MQFRCLPYPGIPNSRMENNPRKRETPTVASISGDCSDSTTIGWSVHKTARQGSISNTLFRFHPAFVFPIGGEGCETSSER